MTRFHVSAVAVCLALGALAPLGAARAEERAGRWEGGVLGGFVALDEALRGPDHRTVEPNVGGRVGYQWRPRWQLFGDVVVGAFDTDTFREDVTTYTARGGIELGLSSGGSASWFLQGAAGYTELRSDEPRVWSAVASAALGQRIPAGSAGSWRWELRVDGWLAEDGLEGNDVVETRFLMGWSWGGAAGRAGAAPVAGPVETGTTPADADPRPPLPPVAVDAPIDADGDGVPDELDACPKTLAGFEVDPSGCPLDADRDGVYDGLGMDKCPGTPAGVPVDVHGCPVDPDDGGDR